MKTPSSSDLWTELELTRDNLARLEAELAEARADLRAALAGQAVQYGVASDGHPAGGKRTFPRKTRKEAEEWIANRPAGLFRLVQRTAPIAAVLPGQWQEVANRDA